MLHPLPTTTMGKTKKRSKRSLSIWQRIEIQRLYRAADHQEAIREIKDDSNIDSDWHKLNELKFFMVCLDIYSNQDSYTEPW